MACLAHFGPAHCQACHLLFLALQVATAAALPRDPGDAPKSTELIFGDEMWQAAHKLRGYAGVAFLSPEGPIINEVRVAVSTPSIASNSLPSRPSSLSSQVLKAINARSAKDAAYPAWVDRLQSVDCLHASDGVVSFFVRHHAELFVPLLQLTGLPACAPRHAHDSSTICDETHRVSCLGCALEMEREAWVKARDARGVADPTLRRDDTITHKSIPRKIRRYAAAVGPLLASLPCGFAEQLAVVMGISVDWRGKPQAVPSGASESAAGSLAQGSTSLPFGGVWRRAVLPTTPQLADTIKARPLGRPAPNSI